MTNKIKVGVGDKLISGHDLTLLRRIKSLKSSIEYGVPYCYGISPQNLVDDKVAKESFSHIGPSEITYGNVKTYLDNLVQFGLVEKMLNSDHYAVAAYGNQILTMFENVEVL